MAHREQKEEAPVASDGSERGRTRDRFGGSDSDFTPSRNRSQAAPVHQGERGRSRHRLGDFDVDFSPSRSRSRTPSRSRKKERPSTRNIGFVEKGWRKGKRLVQGWGRSTGDASHENDSLTMAGILYETAFQHSNRRVDESQVQRFVDAFEDECCGANPPDVDVEKSLAAVFKVSTHVIQLNTRNSSATGLMTISGSDKTASLADLLRYAVLPYHLLTTLQSLAIDIPKSDGYHTHNEDDDNDNTLEETVWDFARDVILHYVQCIEKLFRNGKARELPSGEEEMEIIEFKRIDRDNTYHLVAERQKISCVLALNKLLCAAAHDYKAEGVYHWRTFARGETEVKRYIGNILQVGLLALVAEAHSSEGMAEVTLKCSDSLWSALFGGIQDKSRLEEEMTRFFNELCNLFKDLPGAEDSSMKMNRKAFSNFKQLAKSFDSHPRRSTRASERGWHKVLMLTQPSKRDVDQLAMLLVQLYRQNILGAQRKPAAFLLEKILQTKFLSSAQGGERDDLGGALTAQYLALKLLLFHRIGDVQFQGFEDEVAAYLEIASQKLCMKEFALACLQVLQPQTFEGFACWKYASLTCLQKVFDEVPEEEVLLLREEIAECIIAKLQYQMGKSLAKADSQGGGIIAVSSGVILLPQRMLGFIGAERGNSVCLLNAVGVAGYIQTWVDHLRRKTLVRIDSSAQGQDQFMNLMVWKDFLCYAWAILQDMDDLGIDLLRNLLNVMRLQYLREKALFLSLSYSNESDETEDPEAKALTARLSDVLAFSFYLSDKLPKDLGNDPSFKLSFWLDQAWYLPIQSSSGIQKVLSTMVDKIIPGNEALQSEASEPFLERIADASWFQRLVKDFATGLVPLMADEDLVRLLRSLADYDRGLMTQKQALLTFFALAFCANVCDGLPAQSEQPLREVTDLILVPLQICSDAKESFAVILNSPHFADLRKWSDAWQSLFLAIGEEFSSNQLTVKTLSYLNDEERYEKILDSQGMSQDGNLPDQRELRARYQEVLRAYSEMREFYLQQLPRSQTSGAREQAGFRNRVLLVMQKFGVDCAAPLHEGGTFTIVQVDDMLRREMKGLLVADILLLESETKAWRQTKIHDGSDLESATVDDLLQTLYHFWDPETDGYSKSSLFTLYYRRELQRLGQRRPFGTREETSPLAQYQFWGAIARAKHALHALLVESPSCNDIYDAQMILTRNTRGTKDISKMVQDEIILLRSCPGLHQIRDLDNFAQIIKDVFDFATYLRQIPPVLTSLHALGFHSAVHANALDQDLKSILDYFVDLTGRTPDEADLSISINDEELQVVLGRTTYDQQVRPFLRKMHEIGYDAHLLSRLEIFRSLEFSQRLWKFVVEHNLTTSEAKFDAVRELLSNADYDYVIFEEFELATNCLQVLRSLKEQSFRRMLETIGENSHFSEASSKCFLCIELSTKHMDKIENWFLEADDESYAALKKFQEYLAGGVYTFEMPRADFGRHFGTRLTLVYDSKNLKDQEGLVRRRIFEDFKWSKDDYEESVEDVRKTIIRLGFQRDAGADSTSSVRFFLDQHNTMLRLKDVYDELSEHGYRGNGTEVVHTVLADHVLLESNDLSEAGGVGEDVRLFQEQRKLDFKLLRDARATLREWHEEIERNMRQYPHLQVLRAKEILWLFGVSEGIEQLVHNEVGLPEQANPGGDEDAGDPALQAQLASLVASLFLGLRRIPALQAVSINEGVSATFRACVNLDERAHDNFRAPPTFFVGIAVQSVMDILGEEGHLERPAPQGRNTQRAVDIPPLSDAFRKSSLFVIHSVKNLSRDGVTRLVIQLCSPDPPEHYQVLFCNAQLNASHVASFLRCLRAEQFWGKPFVIFGVERLSVRCQELIARYQQDAKLFAQDNVGRRSSRAFLHCIQRRPTLLQEQARDGIQRWEDASQFRQNLYQTLSKRVLQKGGIRDLRLFVGSPGSGKTYRARLLQRSLAKKWNARQVELPVNEAFSPDELCEQLQSLLVQDVERPIIVFFNFSFGVKEVGHVEDASGFAGDADSMEGWDALMDSVNDFFLELLVMQGLRSIRSGAVFALPENSLYVIVEVPQVSALRSRDVERLTQREDVQTFLNHVPILKCLYEKAGTAILVKNEDPYLLQGDELQEDGEAVIASGNGAIDPKEQNVFKYLDAYFNRGQEPMGPHHINCVYDDDACQEVRMSSRRAPSLEERQRLLARALSSTDEAISDDRATSILGSKPKIVQKSLVRYLLRRVEVMENLPGYQYYQEAALSISQRKQNGLGSLLFSLMLTESRDHLYRDLSGRGPAKEHRQLVYEREHIGGGYTVGLLSTEPIRIDGKTRRILQRLNFDINRVSENHYGERGLSSTSDDPAAIVQRADIELEFLRQREQMDHFLSRALSRPLRNETYLHEIDSNRFVLTLDFFVKMLTLNEAFESNVPVVIRGETGVGKTFLVRMLSILRNRPMAKTDQPHDRVIEILTSHFSLDAVDKDALETLPERLFSVCVVAFVRRQLAESHEEPSGHRRRRSSIDDAGSWQNFVRASRLLYGSAWCESFEESAILFHAKLREAWIASEAPSQHYSKFLRIAWGSFQEISEARLRQWRESFCNANAERVAGRYFMRWGGASDSESVVEFVRDIIQHLVRWDATPTEIVGKLRYLVAFDYERRESIELLRRLGDGILECVKSQPFILADPDLVQATRQEISEDENLDRLLRGSVIPRTTMRLGHDRTYSAAMQEMGDDGVSQINLNDLNRDSLFEDRSRHSLQRNFLQLFRSANGTNEQEDNDLALFRLCESILMEPPCTSFFHINMHGAYTPAQIQEEFKEPIRVAGALRAFVDPQATEEDFCHTVTVFIDEFNTCSVMGLMKEILCDHSLLGQALPKNLTVVAACNPKRKQAIKSWVNNEAHDEMDRLLPGFHQVKDLPPSLDHLVQDYGALSAEKEVEYLQVLMDKEAGYFAANTGDQEARGPAQEPPQPDLILFVSALREFVRTYLGKRRAANGNAGPNYNIEDRELAVLAEQDLIWQLVTQEDIQWKECLKGVANRISTAQQLVREYAGEEMEGAGVEFADGEIAQRATSVVSQRDIQRCVRLFKYFLGMIRAGVITIPDEGGETPLEQEQERLQAEVEIARDTAIACVYYLRLDKSPRESGDGRSPRESFNLRLRGTKSHLEIMMKAFDHVQVADGIAKNEALREQLFLTLVCTVTKTPLFLLGPPGSGKTLSFNIIVQNLRGSDSPDVFFRKESFPFLQPHYYQCSTKSTSTQVKAVFERARARQERVDQKQVQNYRHVVFLDEAGLPEAKRESLKVLHYYLDHPSTSFVASSNARPDAAKANRAILCERSNLTLKELKEIGRAAGPRITGDQGVSAELLDSLCSIYLGLLKQDWFKKFFGHRDFTYFLRHLSRWIKDYGVQMRNERFVERPKPLLHAVQRNFSGKLPEEDEFGQVVDYNEKVQRTFLMDSEILHGESVSDFIAKNRLSPVELVQSAFSDKPRPGESQSLRDVLPRPKLIIDNSLDDSVMELMFKFRLLDRSNTMIFQISNFPEMEELEKMQIVAGVKHAAAKGRTVVLSQTESIHESFYDLFNQHFRESRNKDGEKLYFASVAVGDVSESTSVDPDFMCIVLVRNQDVSRQPAPFLNRFEKYTLCHEDFLSDFFKKLPNGVMRFLSFVLDEMEAFLDGHKDFTHGIYGYAPKQTVISLLLSVVPDDFAEILEHGAVLEISEDCHEEEKKAHLDGPPMQARAPSLSADIAEAIVTEIGTFAVNTLGFRPFPCNAVHDPETLYGVVERLSKKCLAQAQLGSLCQTPSLCVAWLQEALQCLTSGLRSQRYERSRMSFSVALFCWWIKSNCLMRLLNLTAPESVVVCLNRLPTDLCRQQLLRRERVDFRDFLKTAVAKDTRLLMTYTRSGRYLHRLPSIYDPSCDDASEEYDGVIASMIWEAPREVKLFKMSAFRTQRDFSAAVASFLASPSERVFIVIMDIANSEDIWSGLEEENATVSGRRASVNRRTNFIRLVLEGAMQSSDAAEGKVACIMLRVPPDCLHVRPAFASLFSPSWEHLFFDEIAPVGTATNAFLLFSMEQAMKDATGRLKEHTLGGFEADANRLIKNDLREKLPQMVEYFVHRAMSLSRRQDDYECRRRVHQVQSVLEIDFVKDPVAPEALRISITVADVVLQRFLALWDGRTAKSHIFHTAKEHVTGATRNTTFNRSIGRPFDYDFEYFVSWFLEQLCLNKVGRFAAEASHGIKMHLLDMLTILPAPPLPEIRVQGTCQRDWSPMWKALDTPWGVHPFFASTFRDVESMLHEASSVREKARQEEANGADGGVVSTAHEIIRSPGGFQETIDEILQHDKKDERLFIETVVEKHAMDIELFRAYLMELFVFHGFVHDFSDERIFRCVRALVRALEEHILSKRTPRMRLFQAHAEMSIRKTQLLHLFDVLVSLVKLTSGIAALQNPEDLLISSLSQGWSHEAFASPWTAVIGVTYDSAIESIRERQFSASWLEVSALLSRVELPSADTEEQKVQAVVTIGFLSAFVALERIDPQLLLNFTAVSHDDDRERGSLLTLENVLDTPSDKGAFLDRCLDWGLRRMLNRLQHATQNEETSHGVEIGVNYVWMSNYLSVCFQILNDTETRRIPKSRRRHLLEIALRCDKLWQGSADGPSPAAQTLFAFAGHSAQYRYLPPKYRIHLVDRHQRGIDSVLADAIFLQRDQEDEQDAMALTDSVLRHLVDDLRYWRSQLRRPSRVEGAFKPVLYAAALEHLLRCLARALAQRLAIADDINDEAEALQASKLPVLSADDFSDELQELLQTEDETLNALYARSFLDHLLRKTDCDEALLQRRVHRFHHSLRDQFQRLRCVWICMEALKQCEDEKNRERGSQSLRKLDPMLQEAAKPPFMTRDRESPLGRIFDHIKDLVHTDDQAAILEMTAKFKDFLDSQPDQKGVRDLRYLLFMTIYWEHCDRGMPHEAQLLAQALQPDGVLYRQLQLTEEESNLFLAFLQLSKQQENTERWAYMTDGSNYMLQAREGSSFGNLNVIGEMMTTDDALDFFNFKNMDTDRDTYEIRHAVASVVGNVLGSADCHPLRMHLLTPGSIHGTYPLGSLYNYAVDGIHFDCGTEIVRSGIPCRSGYRQVQHLSRESYHLSLFLSYAPVFASLIAQGDVYSRLRGGVFSTWIPLNAHIKAKLEEVWGFLGTASASLRHRRMLLLTGVAENLRTASFSGDASLRPTFKTAEERSEFEKFFAASVVNPVSARMRQMEDGCRDVLQISQEAQELAHFSSSAASQNTILTLATMDEEALLARCTSTAEEDDDEHLAFIRAVVRDRNKLVALSALPSLFAAYKWVHRTLTGMITKEKAMNMTIGSLISSIDDSDRWSERQAGEVMRFWHKVLEDAKLVRMGYRRMGAGPCGELAVEERNDKSSSVIDVPEISMDTSIHVFIAPDDEENMILPVLEMLCKEYNKLGAKYAHLFEQMRQRRDPARRAPFGIEPPSRDPVSLERLGRNHIIFSDYADSKIDGQTGRSMVELLAGRYSAGWFHDLDPEAPATFDTASLAWDIYDCFLARKAFVVDKFEGIARKFRFFDAKGGPGGEILTSRTIKEVKSLRDELCESAVSRGFELSNVNMTRSWEEELQQIWRGLSLDDAITLLRKLVNLQQRVELRVGDLRTVLSALPDADRTSLCSDLEDIFKVAESTAGNLIVQDDENGNVVYEHESLLRTDVRVLPLLAASLVRDIEAGWFDFGDVPASMKHSLPEVHRAAIRGLLREYELDGLSTAQSEGVVHDGNAVRTRYVNHLRELEADLKSIESYIKDTNGGTIGDLLESVIGTYEVGKLPAKIFKDVQISCYVEVMCELKKLRLQETYGVLSDEEEANRASGSYDIYAKDHSLWSALSSDLSANTPVVVTPPPDEDVDETKSQSQPVIARDPLWVESDDSGDEIRSWQSEEKTEHQDRVHIAPGDEHRVDEIEDDDNNSDEMYPVDLSQHPEQEVEDFVELLKELPLFDHTNDTGAAPATEGEPKVARRSEAGSSKRTRKPPDARRRGFSEEDEYKGAIEVKGSPASSPGGARERKAEQDAGAAKTAREESYVADLRKELENLKGLKEDGLLEENEYEDLRASAIRSFRSRS
uniref:AAA+ ATPase domain-containing protein n=1 Tax=Pinguiococcus pyrenoidosus TaxID=172671 RepID=A0A7R9YEM9_9STRA|mmetsp:Transcript_630/g.2361  ORF Transcript_630/g.2361 Transcript_630/m.2361 type:complete len:6096 (+) Transcript_630:218-18505(+)